MSPGSLIDRLRGGPVVSSQTAAGANTASAPASSWAAGRSPDIGAAGHLGQYRAGAGAAWAVSFRDAALGWVAAAFAALQAPLDPDCIVFGGGVGLAPGVTTRLRQQLAGLPDLLCPDLRAAALGAQAGLPGVADHIGD